MDLSIVNGVVPTTEGYLRQDIGIAGGKIALIAEPGLVPPSTSTIDVQGDLLLPGTIDSHFHCRAPIEPEKEDFQSATQAAANGGVTTLLEMPITIPPSTDGPFLADRQSQAEGKLYVNMGFYAAAGTLDLEKVQSAADTGAIAFKIFYQPVPAGREADLTGLCVPDLGNLRRAMQQVAGTGKPLVIHAEEHHVYALLEHELREARRTDPQAHVESRPAYVEAMAIGPLILLAEAMGIHFHIPHVSSAMSVELIRLAKRRGARITAETCPHYLTFTGEVMSELGPYAKCNPPLKSQEDVDALWEGISDGTIDTIATDHSPSMLRDKENGRDDIWHAPPGISGVDILTPFVMTAALEGKLGIHRAIELITSAPARIFGLGERKGLLAPGYDADIVTYTTRGTSRVDSGSWLSRSRHGGRIWDGFQITGSVSRTIVGGSLVLENGMIVSPPGTGAVIKT